MDNLGRAQASRRVESLRLALKDSKVRPGWIQYMRKALGIKVKDLARMTKLSPQTITETEQREAQGKITLNNLNKMAAAMDCDLVYALIPKTDIESLIDEKARAKARALLRAADIHMSLEDQKVQSDLEERVRHIADKLKEKGDVW